MALPLLFGNPCRIAAARLLPIRRGTSSEDVLNRQTVDDWASNGRSRNARAWPMKRFFGARQTVRRHVCSRFGYIEIGPRAGRMPESGLPWQASLLGRHQADPIETSAATGRT